MPRRFYTMSKVTYEGAKSPFNYETFDSGSELCYAKALDNDAKVLAWTKKHNIVIKYRNSKGGLSRYHPDFLVRRTRQVHLELVEIKGAHLRHDPNTDLKARAAQDWCKQRGMQYILLEV
jgi:hypothetical protein